MSGKEATLDLKIGRESLGFVAIPPGEFIMGSANEIYGESPAHRVRIGREFALGRTPVTQAQWEAAMGSNPSRFRGAERPVECISWSDATAFCRRVSELTGVMVRLPNEAEWEYACRAGTTGDLAFGPWGPYLDESEMGVDVCLAIAEFAWIDLNSGGRTRPVGERRTNAWGLADMIGNVWEWCADVWHDDYTGAPEDGTAWMAEEELQPRRCLRGGAWDMDAFRCRSTYRSREGKDLGTPTIGLRVAVDRPHG